MSVAESKTSSHSSDPSSDEPRAVPVRHPGRWVAAALVLLICAALARSVATNPRFGWDTVGRYLFAAEVIDGVLTTLVLTVLSLVLGVGLGVVLAVMRLSPNRLLSSVSWTFIWFFRGTPLLVQILFWSFISALYPTIALGIPFGPALFEGSANSLITPFVAVVLALGLNEAAYMAEIVRAGILSVDDGQSEAAQALGMTRLKTLRHVVLPQAIRVIIPPTGNEAITMLKNTALASVIAYKELLYTVQLVYAANYEQIPLLLVASAWYLALTSVLYVGQHYLERHYGRSSAQPESILSRWRARRGLPPTGAAEAR